MFIFYAQKGTGATAKKKHVAAPSFEAARGLLPFLADTKRPTSLRQLRAVHEADLVTGPGPVTITQAGVALSLPQ